MTTGILSQFITISGIVKGIKEQLTANGPQIAGKESATMKSGKRIEGKREKNTGTTKGQRKKKIWNEGCSNQQPTDKEVG